MKRRAIAISEVVQKGMEGFFFLDILQKKNDEAIQAAKQDILVREERKVKKHMFCLSFFFSLW